MMPNQRQTVTFLFSDIEGSTKLLARLGEHYAATLEQHRRIVRAALHASGGEEHGTEGDSFFVTFGSASAAVTAAIQIQHDLSAATWHDDATPLVRIGLHTGEAQRSEEGWVGLEVHRAARIAALGHGGQVLLSASTRELAGRPLPCAADVRDLGAHTLKDIEHPETIFQLIVEGLRSDFPALRGHEGVPNNLPTQLTSFVGRDQQLEEVEELLRRSRLLTLVGPGGTGKTRLSLRLASDMLAEFPDGVWFVALAPVFDAHLLAPKILAVLGLADHGAEGPSERLRTHLHERRCLLVLDSFEQILEAAPLVGEILADAPGVCVLVSSRAALHVQGEQEYAVPPLAVPPQGIDDPDALTDNESVALFVARAQAVKPDFRLSKENAAAVAAICGRLDGLPLAIELAAARVKLLPPQSLFTRLGAGLDVLDSQARDLPARQRTLRGAMAWSHDLLDAPIQALFARLAVFRGGWTLEMAEQTCDMGDGDVLKGLIELVDHSLVRQIEGEGEPRFLMLGTIREYATELLIASGAQPTMRSRHADAFLALAEAGAGKLMGSSGSMWLDRLEAELDNFRAALDYTIAEDDDRALRLGSALWRVWEIRGHLYEGRRLLTNMVDSALDFDPALMSKALEALGGVAYWQGDAQYARTVYERMLVIERERGDEMRIAEGLYRKSLTYLIDPEVHGKPVYMVPLLEEALAVYRKVGADLPAARCSWAIAYALFAQGVELADAGDNQGALAAFEEALSPAGEGLVVFRANDDWSYVVWSLHLMGISYLRLHHVDTGRAVLTEGLDLLIAHGDVSGMVLLIDDFSQLALEVGREEDAWRLRGSGERMRVETGAELGQVANEGALRQTKAELSAEQRAFWDEGLTLSTEAAIALARTL